MTLISSHPRRALSRGLWSLCALLVIGAAACATLQPAHAATNGSDWGPDGATTTNSAVTVSWDNANNPAADTVPRNSSQVLPYTGGKKTYSDVTPSVSAGAKAAFGGMSLTVTQTQNLDHQGVSLTVTGVTGGAGGINRAGAYLEVFQCWGGPSVDNQPDTNQPDPEHCQSGAGGVDNPGQDTNRNIAAADESLIAGGDMKAATLVELTGMQTGGTVSLTARIAMNGTGAIATGALGTVEFDNTDGTVIQKGVPVAKGVATVSTPAPAAGTTADYTATYTAAPAENFASSAPSTDLTLPPSWDIQNGATIPAGSSNLIAFPPGTFGDSDPVTVSLDRGADTPAGTADAFGGLTVDYTVPSTLTAGSTHTLAFTDSIASRSHTTPFTITPAPTGAGAGAGTNTPNKTAQVPFVPVDGVTANALSGQFTTATTNEFSDFAPADTPGGTVSRTFEMQTGAEAPDLGCGAQSDKPSTATCWLVAVPRGFAGDPGINNVSPLSPSLWAQRVQVKLGYTAIAATCPGGQARTLTAGSELLDDAMASWVPGLCAADKIDLGYATVGDPQARQQYSAGQQNLVFTSQPIDDSGGGTDTLYAPVGLTAVTIGYRMFDFRTDQQVTGIKLNARLVAKLLTESYSDAIDNANGTQIGTKAPWVYGAGEIQNLIADPEFQALNPTVPTDGDVSDFGDLVVDSTASDADALLWNWIVSDPDAKAFLDGCPDPASGNTVINPFYSTATYTECSSQAAALTAVASAEIAETVTPSNYHYAPQVYPPTAAAFPQPSWYERDATGEGANQEQALPIANIHAREGTLASVGLDVFHGSEPATNAWCPISQDADCTSGPGTVGKWEANSNASLTNTVLGTTDAATAAQYQEATAQLCDDSTNCVGADTTSLQGAAAEFQQSNPAGAPQPPAAQDEKGGAYPLALPVYAEVNTQGLAPADAKTIATALGYITTAGQTSGFASGNLPPGYAPLTKTMAAQAATTISALNAITAPASVPDTEPQPAPQGVIPDTVPAPAAVGPAVAPAAAVPNPEILAKIGTTPASDVWFPQYGLFVGLGIAIVAGSAAALTGRKRRGDRP